MKRHLAYPVITAFSCLLLAALAAAGLPASGAVCALIAPAPSCPDFYWQNPLPQGNNLNDVEALADGAAIAVGDNGVILKTVDSGTTWSALASGVSADLYGVSAAGADTIWVAGGQGTMLKTIDGGGTWTPQDATTVTDINDVCAVSADVAWAAADGDIDTGGIPLVTTDGGDTWQQKLDPAGEFSLLTGVSAISATDAWICGPGTVARTTDGGGTWDRGKAPEAGYIYRVCMFDAGTAVVVGNGGAFMRTDNGGDDWELMDTGVNFDLYSLSFLDDQTGWIAGNNGYVARTADGGQTWDVQDSKRNTALLGVSAQDAGRAWSCGYWDTLLLTEDGGNNWVSLDSGDQDGLFGLCLVGDRTLFAVGFDSTFLKSCDGGNVWAGHALPVAADYFDISAWDLDLAWAVGEAGTIVHTADGGDNWTVQKPGVKKNLYGVDAASDTVVWAAGSDTLLKTEDGGATWNAVTNHGLSGDLRVEAVDDRTAWVYGSWGGVARTSDGGATWQEQVMSMGASFDIGRITCMSALGPQIAYATVVACQTGMTGDFSVVFRTIDGGNTWSNTYPAGQGEFDLFAVATADADTAWAGGLFGTVVKTTDGGNNWVRQEALTDNVVNAMACNGSHTAWLAARGGNILRTTDPAVYAAAPSLGMNTDTALPFKVEGLGFQAGMTIELVRSGQPAIVGGAVKAASTKEAICTFDLTGAAEGAWDVVVTNPNGLLFTLEDAFQVVSATRWYLPEGSTGSNETGGFETWVLLQNPGDVEAGVELTYLTSSGEVAGPTVPVPAHGRATVNVAETVPNDWSVATVAESEQQIIAESSLYWNQAGGNYRQACGESLGLPGLSTRWYLPEGSTGSNETGGFETWVLLGNPGTQPARVDVTFLTSGGMKEGPVIELPPGTRQSVNVADTVPDEWSVSTLVESDVPIMAERTLYWDAPDEARSRLSSTSSIGAIAPAMEWYLPEGSTGANDQGGFETWILVENPGDYTATARLYYQTPLGEVGGPAMVLPPRTRRTVNVAETVPGEFSVSTLVESDNPVVCERSTYWSTADNARWSATGSIGATMPGEVWDLAEGSTGSNEQGGFETWVLVQNPLPVQAAVEITYMTPLGEIAGPAKVVPPLSRITVNVGETVADEWSVSTMVRSDQPVVVERAVYWNAPASYRQSASGSIGSSL